MIVDMPATTIGSLSKRLLALRQDVGAMALGRVLTLIIVVDDAHCEQSLKIAQDATHSHPSRIVTVIRSSSRGAPRIDGQIRVGGDAGASEMVVLRLFGELTKHGPSVVLPLLLPDSPIVAWWPGEPPKNPAKDPVGSLAQRRITDCEQAASPSDAIAGRAKVYVAGDTDLCWTRTTKWRAVLASALDQPPYEQVTAATVSGAADSGTADLFAGWLATYLDCPVDRIRTAPGSGLASVRLQRDSGAIDLIRPDGVLATLEQPGQPARRLAMARRSDRDCLADELARLDADQVYARVLADGLPRIEGVQSGARSRTGKDIGQVRAALRRSRQAVKGKLSGAAAVASTQAEAAEATDVEVVEVVEVATDVGAGEVTP